MNPVGKNQNLVQSPSIEKPQKSLLIRLKEKIYTYFFKEKQAEIYHLGGSPVTPVFFPTRCHLA